jgi:hypothetical protein
MEREVAENIVQYVKKMEQVLLELEAVTRVIEDTEQRRRLRLAISRLGIDAYEKITREVVKQFPDLHPDKDRM